MNKYLSIFITILLFTSCKNESQLWRIPIGYKNFNISLGDKYFEINKKLDHIMYDVNSDNNDTFKNYFKIANQIEIENFKINPIIFLRFNENELVRFEIVYTINETEKDIDFETIIKKLSKKELVEIRELINKKKKSIANNQELWLKRIETITTGEYPEIRYRVQVIP